MPNFLAKLGDSSPSTIPIQISESFSSSSSIRCFLQDAKVNYNNAQCSYIETIYKYNVARANLESVIAMPQQVTVTLEGK